MKDTLIEIKNNLQGNNNRVQEAENQISDLEHKETNNNQSEQQEEKKNPKIQGQYKQPLGLIQKVQYLHHRGARRRRERGRNWKLILKIKKENFPNLVKEIDMQGHEHRGSQTRWTQRDPLQHISYLNDKG